MAQTETENLQPFPVFTVNSSLRSTGVSMKVAPPEPTLVLVDFHRPSWSGPDLIFPQKGNSLLCQLDWFHQAKLEMNAPLAEAETIFPVLMMCLLFTVTGYPSKVCGESA